MSLPEDLGLGRPAGDQHYRAYVGPPQNYDLISAMSFGLLTALGLRQHHSLLDIGCGSLRNGRLLIPYLNRERYVGIEPNRWLVEEGIARELGASLIGIKGPRFHFAASAEGLDLDSHFDFALAQSIFSHTGRDLLEHWLHSIIRLLKPSGALIATYFLGDSEPSETGWIYPGGVRFPEATMAACARQQGFRFRPLDWRHPSQRWALFARPEFDDSWFAERPLGWNTWFDYGRK